MYQKFLSTADAWNVRRGAKTAALLFCFSIAVGCSTKSDDKKVPESSGTDGGETEGGGSACGGEGGLANKDLADIKRIAPGDPRNSLAVMLTDIPGQYKAVPEFIAYDYSRGGEFRYCSGTNLEQIWMPRGKKNTGDTNYVWPKWAHDKFARWVLQGAKTTDG
jgi:hypothetical protein